MAEDMHKERSETEMRGALQHFIDGKGRLSIPPNLTHDDDMILCDAITELMAQRGARHTTATLPRYLSSNPCPKCGDTHAATRHVSTAAAENYVRNYPGHGVEHMERVCERCNFRWVEAPLDVTAENGATPTSEQGGDANENVCDEYPCGQCMFDSAMPEHFNPVCKKTRKAGLPREQYRQQYPGSMVRTDLRIIGEAVPVTKEGN